MISETATSGNFDGIVSITDSMGVVLVDQDLGTDEVVTFFPPATGNYTVTFRRFGTTSGNFNLVVNTATGSPLLTTDLNLPSSAWIPASMSALPGLRATTSQATDP